MPQPTPRRCYYYTPRPPPLNCTICIQWTKKNNNKSTLGSRNRPWSMHANTYSYVYYMCRNKKEVYAGDLFLTCEFMHTFASDLLPPTSSSSTANQKPIRQKRIFSFSESKIHLAAGLPHVILGANFSLNIVHSSCTRLRPSISPRPETLQDLS